MGEYEEFTLDYIGGEDCALKGVERAFHNVGAAYTQDLSKNEYHTFY